MTRTALLLGGAVAVALGAGLGARAEMDDDTLVIDGETITTHLTETPEGHPLPELVSGWRFRTDETQSLQMDDFENPGFIYVDHGMEVWNAPAGTSNKSCADCHGDPSSMAGLRAQMPKWSEVAGQPWALSHWINWSREEHQGAEPLKWESQDMLGLTALIGLQSRGMPVGVDVDGPMQEWLEKGEELYYTRVGQLDMACANCHEGYYGNMIRADHLSQGHSNGFPLYRLKWQGMGSLHRRFTGCMRNIRAVPYERGSEELTALELYLAWRGEGLEVETPAVRQ